MFNHTHLNPTVIKNIIKAMASAHKHGIAHVRNRKGDAFLAVRKVVYKGKVFFQVLDRAGNNIRRLIGDRLIDLAAMGATTWNIIRPILRRVGWDMDLSPIQEKYGLHNARLFCELQAQPQPQTQTH